ncbi:hypothetical protein CPB83DRAFT_898042 [Crepidotus variabilis]|uniref:Uncharacterized protein n=1 Tax=Crepidotus variabilis TaxID=179855 RepID=A0A9P6E895_9AGAR|nr:hypothetical protein CPB83DRAFT_898042 [Crepidotus variabilis]
MTSTRSRRFKLFVVFAILAFVLGYNIAKLAFMKSALKQSSGLDKAGSTESAGLENAEHFRNALEVDIFW